METLLYPFLCIILLLTDTESSKSSSAPVSVHSFAVIPCCLQVFADSKLILRFTRSVDKDGLLHFLSNVLVIFFSIFPTVDVRVYPSSSKAL